MTNTEKGITLTLKNVPSEYSVKGSPEGIIKVSPHAKQEIAVSFTASQDASNAKFIAEINDAGKTLEMQLGIITLNAHKHSVPGEK